MKYIWQILGIIAIISAILNICLNIQTVFRQKLMHSCSWYITEYIMAAVILLWVLRERLSSMALMISLAIIAFVWTVVMIWFAVKHRHFVRVYGIRTNMHERIREMLEALAIKYGLHRTNVYLYGGDRKTPCNTIVFRSVSGDIRKKIITETNAFLSVYAANVYRMRAVAVILDFLVIGIIVFTML